MKPINEIVLKISKKNEKEPEGTNVENKIEKSSKTKWKTHGKGG